MWWGEDEDEDEDAYRKDNILYYPQKETSSEPNINLAIVMYTRKNVLSENKCEPNYQRWINTEYTTDYSEKKSWYLCIEM